MLPKFIKKPFIEFCVKNQTSLSKVATITGAATFAISSAGQAFGLWKNKKIPDKEKKFLVKQEIMEGTVNVALLLTVTRLLEPRLERFFNKNLIQSPGSKSHLFKSGCNTLGVLIGQILVLNFCTPLIRNELTHYFKKKKNIEELNVNKQPKLDIKENVVSQNMSQPIAKTPTMTNARANMSDFLAVTKHSGMTI